MMMIKQQQMAALQQQQHPSVMGQTHQVNSQQYGVSMNPQQHQVIFYIKILRGSLLSEFVLFCLSLFLHLFLSANVSTTTAKVGSATINDLWCWSIWCDK